MPHSRECLIHFTWDLAVYTVVTCHFVGLSSAIYRTLWQVRGSFRHISETLLALHRLIPGSKGTKIVGMWGPSFMVLLEFVVRFNLSRRIFSTNTLLRLFIYLIVYNLQNFINFFFTETQIRHARFRHFAHPEAMNRRLVLYDSLSPCSCVDS